MKKTILFDLLNAQPAKNSKFHGGGEYCKVIFQNLVNKYNSQCNIITFFDDDKFIDDWLKELIEVNNITYYNIKSIDKIKDIFLKENIDIYFSGLPYFLKEEYFTKDVLKIGTIHGLRLIEKPIDDYSYLFSSKHSNNVGFIINKLKKYFKYGFNTNKEMYRHVMNILDKIITDSYYSKYSICNFFPNIDMKKVEVFYAPSKKYNSAMLNDIKKEKYILLLGGDRWEKNVYRAIQAIEGLFNISKLPDYKVIVIGKLTSKITSNIKNINRYELLDYVDSEKLEQLYRDCDIFLYPSLNEGFGLPPLEAMKYGKTCIVSAVTSLPEIYGNAVYYINPYDIYEIRNKLLMASEEKIPIDLIQKQLNFVNEKQISDLDKLCEYIIYPERYT